MSDFFLKRDGTEIHYDDLICECGTKADDMDDSEAHTLLSCVCGQIYLHIIWELDKLMKKNPEKF